MHSYQMRGLQDSTPKVKSIGSNRLLRGVCIVRMTKPSLTIQSKRLSLKQRHRLCNPFGCLTDVTRLLEPTSCHVNSGYVLVTIYGETKPGQGQA
jgi:hypothetical protein